jgi:hypothetical protein
MGSKRLRAVVAETNVLVRTSEVDPQNNHLMTRAEINCQQLTFDNLTGQLVASGSGWMMLEDYRPPDHRPQPAGQPQATPTRPSQTKFVWERSMQFSQDTLLATFEQAVRVYHRGPAGVAVRADGSVEIRENVVPAELNCRQLQLQFVRAPRPGQPAGQPAGQPGGGLSAQTDTVQDLRWMRATGAIYLEDANLRLLGDILEYFKDTDTIIFGCEGDGKAEIYRLARDGSKFDRLAAPRIQWNRTTGRIEPFEGQFEGSSGGGPRGGAGR